MSNRIRTTAGVALTMAVGALLGGCTANPGTAAVVGDRTISQSSVNRAVEELALLDPTIEPRGILVQTILAPYLNEAAAENEAAVSAGEIRAALDEVAAANGVTEIPDWSTTTVDNLRSQTALRNLEQLPDGGQILDDLATEILATDMEINPRYGELVPGTFQITAPDQPWIVDPQS